MFTAEGSTSGSASWRAELAGKEGRAWLRQAALAGPASGRVPLDVEGRSHLLSQLVDFAAVRKALLPATLGVDHPYTFPGAHSLAGAVA